MSWKFPCTSDCRECVQSISCRHWDDRRRPEKLVDVFQVDLGTGCWLICERDSWRRQLYIFCRCDGCLTLISNWTNRIESINSGNLYSDRGIDSITTASTGGEFDCCCHFVSSSWPGSPVIEPDHSTLISIQMEQTLLNQSTPDGNLYMHSVIERSITTASTGGEFDRLLQPFCILKLACSIWYWLLILRC